MRNLKFEKGVRGSDILAALMDPDPEYNREIKMLNRFISYL